MKKKILVLVLGLMLVLPFKTFAQEVTYEKMNLDEALTQEKIEHDFSNYTENSDQITIYLFRGYGCSFCRSFLTFLNSIVPEYGKYFKVETYEVWYNKNNNDLMVNISNFLGQPAKGVPYIIIGEKVFPGYASSYDEDIKKAIKELYETSKDKRYDVMKDFEKNGKDTTANTDSNKNSNSNDVSPWIMVAINIVIVLGAAGAIIYVVYSQNKSIYSKLNNIENKLQNLDKKVGPEKVSITSVKETKTKAKKTTKK